MTPPPRAFAPSWQRLQSLVRKARSPSWHAPQLFPPSISRMVAAFFPDAGAKSFGWHVAHDFSRR